MGGSGVLVSRAFGVGAGVIGGDRERGFDAGRRGVDGGVAAECVCDICSMQCAGRCWRGILMIICAWLCEGLYSFEAGGLEDVCDF